MKLFNIFKKGKDEVVARLIKAIVKPRIANYGTIIHFSIDSVDKKVKLIVDLKGEKENLQVELEEYEFYKKDNETYFKVISMNTSREWINNILDDHKEKIDLFKGIKVPGIASKLF